MLFLEGSTFAYRLEYMYALLLLVSVMFKSRLRMIQRYHLDSTIVKGESDNIHILHIATLAIRHESKGAVYDILDEDHIPPPCSHDDLLCFHSQPRPIR